MKHLWLFTQMTLSVTIKPYGGCAAGYLAIYNKKTVSHSVGTEQQTVNIVFCIVHTL